MPRSGEGFQRAMLLSARRAEAFDLLHWLSVVSARQLVRRRFAASAEDVSDVESDYLDLPTLGDGGVRLIANARRGLAMGVAHAFMPDHEVIVLILDEDADANVRLVDRVLDVCRQTRHAPAIIGLGTHGSVTGELQDRVEVQGHAWVGARSRLVRLTPAGRDKRAEAQGHWHDAQMQLNQLLGVGNVVALHALVDQSLEQLSTLPEGAGDE